MLPDTYSCENAMINSFLVDWLEGRFHALAGLTGLVQVEIFNVSDFGEDYGDKCPHLDHYLPSQITRLPEVTMFILFQEYT